MSAHERVDELKEKLEARTRLMQDVAHELKNPLAVIHGYAAFVLKENVGLEDTRKALRAIYGNAERLIAMVEQLQDSIRLESSGFAVEPRPVDGQALLQEAAESAELEATRRGIRLRWRSPVGALQLSADPKRVMQVLTNLIGNALKFTPQGGEVVVQAQRDGGFVRFSVADSGPGIPADELPMLFDRFYQAKDNTQKGKGLGLGLAICKGIVEAHGGRIWVESLPGSGASFHFTLPSVPAAVRRADPDLDPR